MLVDCWLLLLLIQKVSEYKNKIPVVSDLIKKTYYDVKILELKGKCITTTSDYNEFFSDILDAKVEKIELVNKSNIFNLVKKSGLNAELKTEQDKILKLQTYDLSYFPGKNCFGDDGSLNMFVYQPALDTFELKKARVLIIWLVGNQKGYILLNLSHYILLVCIAQNFLDVNWE